MGVMGVENQAVVQSETAVAHVADFFWRYPGEIVTFFTRVTAGVGLGDFRLRVTLPDGLEYTDCRALSQPSATAPLFSHAEGVTHLIWNVPHASEPSAVYEYWIQAVVSPTLKDLSFESKAVVTAEAQGLYTEEIICVAVKARGHYLKLLPAIYQQDELMGRFLMLFESFLAPIEMQIDHNADYYDPRLAPPEFLPWLASWTGMALDNQLSLKTRRRLLHASAALFRKRGTRRGLEEYLEIYTGGKVQIMEHFSENFRLGEKAFLGPGIAFGVENVPNTFSVRLSVPLNPTWQDADDIHRGKTLIEHKVASIIETEKPVHTGYELYVEIDPNLEYQG
jgi:phage tail-like protein